MSIPEVFAALRQRQEMALIPYLTGAYPAPDAFPAALRAVSDAGPDLIEVGIPFSDPIADGPTIQHSSQTALTHGCRLADVLETLAAVTVPQPTIFMSYLNPLLAFGRERLFERMADAGVAGLIVPDLPVEESDEWLESARAAGRHLIFLAAPTSTDARLREIAQRSDAFVYAVSLAGTTGARGELSAGLPRFLERIRAVTDRPVAVGFGISTPEHVAGLRGLADGAVVGSRLVDALRRQEDLAGLVRALKDATRAAHSSC